MTIISASLKAAFTAQGAGVSHSFLFLAYCTEYLRGIDSRLKCRKINHFSDLLRTSHKTTILKKMSVYSEEAPNHGVLYCNAKVLSAVAFVSEV